MEKKKTVQAVWFVLLAALIVVLNIYYLDIFWNKKDSHHGDECWSYGYSNGYYYGLIYEDEDGNTINQDQWLGADFYKGYIEVQKDQRFSYDSVAYNLSRDTTTGPVYYCVLHTICSLFPDTFSWWYGYGINMVSFIVIIITLFGFSRKILENDFLAFAICVVYGFSTGAISNNIYIRPYALMTMFEMLSMWLQVKMFKCTDDRKHLKLGILNMIVVVVGALTHYYFLALLFFVAAFTDLYYLIKKKWKKMFVYSITMLLGVGISALIWPKMLVDLLGSSENYDKTVPLRWEFSFLMDYCMGESVGVGFPIIDQVVVIYVVSAIAFLFVIWLIPTFLFRNETWFKNLKKKTGNILKRIGSALTKEQGYVWILIISYLLSIAIIAKTSNVFFMGYYANRYVFHLMPFVVVIFAFLVYKIAGALFEKKKVTYAVFVLACVVSIVAVKYTRVIYYLFVSETEDITLEEFVEDKNVVLAMYDDWKISFYADCLRDAKNVYATTEDMIMADDFTKEKAEIPDGKLCFVIEESICAEEMQDGAGVIVDTTHSAEEILTRLEEKFGVHLVKTNRIFYTASGYLLLYEIEQ